MYHGKKNINVNLLPDPHYCVHAGTAAITYWINRVQLNAPPRPLVTPQAGSAGVERMATRIQVTPVAGARVGQRNIG